MIFADIEVRQLLQDTNGPGSPQLSFVGPPLSKVCAVGDVPVSSRILYRLSDANWKTEIGSTAECRTE